MPALVRLIERKFFDHKELEVPGLGGDSPSMMTEQPIRASAVAAPLVMIRLGKIPRRYVFDQVETMALHDIDRLDGGIDASVLRAL